MVREDLGDDDDDCFVVFFLLLLLFLEEEYWHNLSNTRLSSLSSLGEAGPVEKLHGEDTAPVASLPPAPAVPGLFPCEADNVFSLSTIRSRSICLRRYSSGIHTSLETLDLDCDDPDRLDLDLLTEPGGAVGLVVVDMLRELSFDDDEEVRLVVECCQGRGRKEIAPHPLQHSTQHSTPTQFISTGIAGAHALV